MATGERRMVCPGGEWGTTGVIREGVSLFHHPPWNRPPRMHAPAPITAVIVEDEAPARKRLRDLLGGMPGVEVLGECADGPATIQAVERSEERRVGKECRSRWSRYQ